MNSSYRNISHYSGTVNVYHTGPGKSSNILMVLVVSEMSGLGSKWNVRFWSGDTIGSLDKENFGMWSYFYPCGTVEQAMKI